MKPLQNPLRLLLNTRSRLSVLRGTLLQRGDIHLRDLIPHREAILQRGVLTRRGVIVQ